MKNIKLLSCRVWILFTMATCRFEQDPIVIHNNISFESYGLTYLNTISIYPNDHQVINLVRTQGLSKDVVVDILIDKAIIDEYNELNSASLVELPAKYYELPATATFNKETKVMEIPIDIKSSLLYSEVGANLKNMVIPIRIAPNVDLAIEDYKLQALVRIDVYQPTLDVQIPAYDQSYLFIGGVQVTRHFEFTALSNFTTLETGKVRITASQQDVDAYNQENGTDYVLLPSSVYSLSIKSFDVENLTLPFDVSLACADLDVTKTYLLPLRIESEDYTVSQYKPVYVLISIQSIIITLQESVDRLEYSNKTSHLIPFTFKMNAVINDPEPLKLTYRPELVTSYNAENGTAFTAFSAGLLTIPEISIDGGEMSAVVNVAANLSDVAFETEFLLPFQIDKSILVEGTQLPDEIFYVRLKKTMYGLYSPSAPPGYSNYSTNYMNSAGAGNLVNDYILTDEYPYMFKYWTWGHGFFWKILWDQNYNNDPTKKKISCFSTVTSGLSTQEQIDFVYDNNSYFDMTTGEIILIFKYYYSQSDKDSSKPQNIWVKWTNLKAP